MAKLRVGFIGWRGMVGSVLIKRLIEEKDEQKFAWHFFSTSQAGQSAPAWDGELLTGLLGDASDINQLKNMDVILTCQGGDYTKEIYPQLRRAGWDGYWVDAASALRLEEESQICLDPVNGELLEKSLSQGIKTYVGGNCTVSLLLMAINGLIKQDSIEWVSSMTYQAASGGGARHMNELVKQMAKIGHVPETLPANMQNDILQLDKKISDKMRGAGFPTEMFGVPLAGNLIPWIDSALKNGQSREEWKAYSEANKILQRQQNPLPIDGTCVRIGAMRSHSQALTIKLKKNIPLQEIESMLKEGNDWVRLISNNPEATKEALTPSAVSGTMQIPIGRIRKMLLGEEYLNVFTVGDQLLWGAAEPLRRMLRLIAEHESNAQH